MAISVGAIVGELVLKDEFSGRLQDATKNARKGIKDLRLELAVASSAVLGIGAAVVVAAKQTADFQNSIGNAAKMAGVATKQYSALAHGAQFVGVNQDTLNKSLRSLSDLAPDVVKNLNAFGIAIRDQNGELKSNTELLNEVADVMQSYPNAADKATVATRIFGDKAADMVLLLENGSEGLQDFAEQAERFGMIVSEEAAENAALFNDNLDRLKIAAEGVRNTFSETVIEFINTSGILEALYDVTADIIDVWRGLDASTKNIIVTVGALTVVGAALLAGLIAIQAAAPFVGAALTAAFGPVGLIVSGVTLAIVVLVSNINILRSVLEPMQTSINQLRESFADLRDTMGRISDNFGAVSDRFSQLNVFAIGLRATFASLAIAMIKVSSAIQAAVESYTVFAKAVEAVGPIMSDFMQIAGALTRGGFEEAAALYERNAEQMKANIDKFVQSLANADIGSVVARNLYEGNQEIEQVIQGIFAPIPEQAAEAGREAGENVTRELSEQLQETKKEVEKFAKQARETLQGIFDFQGDEAKGIMGQAGKSGKGAGRIDLAGDDAKQLETVGKQLDKSLPDDLFSNLGLGEFNQQIGQALKGMDAFSKLEFAQKVSGQFGTIIDFAGQLVNQLAEINRSQQQVAANRLKQVEFLGEIAVGLLKKQGEAELEAIEEAEDAKISALRDAMNERLALLDEEYARRKEQMEADKQAFIDAERAKFEENKMRILEKSADEEQRRVDDAQLEQDWQNYLQILDEQWKEKLAQQETDFRGKRASLANEEKDKLAKAEAEKNAKIEEQRKLNEQREKQTQKAIALYRWLGQLSALQTTKELEKAMAKIELARAIAGAAGIIATFTSQLGPAGLIAGGVAAAATSAAAIAGYSARIAAINSTQVLPPAELFLAGGGGVIAGPGSSISDSVPVQANLSRGEAFMVMDAQRTRDMFDAAQQSMSRPAVSIAPGAIIVYGSVTNDFAEMVAIKVADAYDRRLNQRAF